MLARSILGVALALGLTGAAAAESRLEQYFRLRKEAGVAAQAQDLAGTEALLEQALTLYPNSPGSLIRLARVEMAADKPDEAAAHLAAYAALGLTWNMAGDPALAPLLERPDFTETAQALTANGRPAGEVATLAEINRPGAIFEGLAAAPDGWLVSSVTGHTILKIVGGQAQPFLQADGETGALFGLAVDAGAGVVWAAEAWGPDIPGSTGPARSGVVKIALADGKVLARYPLADDGKARQLGDVTLGPDGSLYVSDAVGAGIYRLAPGGAALELLIQSPEMGSPQGMAYCGKDSLLVADYATGLHRINLVTGQSVLLDGPPAALAGIDGLFAMPSRVAPEGRLFIASQNGVSPERLLSIRLTADCSRISAVSMLAAGEGAKAGLKDLTLGAASDRWLAVISHGGWSSYGADGKAVAGAPQSPATLIGLARPTD